MRNSIPHFLESSIPARLEKITQNNCLNVKEGKKYKLNSVNGILVNRSERDKVCVYVYIRICVCVYMYKYIYLFYA